MKISALFFVVIASSLNIFSQSKGNETGLYLAASQDSCYGQNNKNTVVFSSDTLCLEQNPIITVKDIESCETETSRLDGKEMYILNIKLKAAAAEKFKIITEKNVGKTIAMIIDKKVIMAGVIRDPITSGMLAVSGEKEQIIKEWGKELKKEIVENKN
jgi:preprotein translocase subunit SecD